LFNGQRGNEPARLQLSDWRGAENGVWINSSHVESLMAVEQQLFSENKLIYIAGKGLHLVPVIVPKDTATALTMLATNSMQKECSVHIGLQYS